MSLESKIGAAIESRRKIMEVLGLSGDIPFRMYAAYIPWYSGGVIPATGTVFDFQKNRYAKDGQGVYLGNVSEFIRLSSATMWQNGKLVEVANNIPRISDEGLLIEPQRTNVARPFTQWFFTTSGADKILGTIDTFAFINTTPQKGAVFSGTRTISGIMSMYVQASESGEAWLQSSGEVYDRYTLSATQIRRYKTPPLQGSRAWGVLAPLGQNTLRYPQEEEGEQITSYIPVGSSPTTRAPDILNIPLLPTQTITGDWDEGITCETVDNVATFTGHGYIRNITVEAL